MKIEEYLSSLPSSIISGDDVELSDETIREIFRFAKLTENDVFYHLGCGNGNSIAIALQEFMVKKAIGIDNNKEKILHGQKLLQEKQITNGSFMHQDITEANISDASVILFWFSDEKIIEKMILKFQNLRPGCRVITLWGPLTGYMPDKIDFPYILNVTPFKMAESLRDQMLAIFNTDCIDFAVAWEFADRYSKAVGSRNFENDRFLTILQTVVIWINAKNLGIACGDEIPDPVKSYIGILKTFFNIEVEHLLDH
ncbi:MAG TPA: methyltransferase domain-containing protein [Candidatus Nitrosotalea sp.]|nr:methyltransferase domain-containing protein [Candidatus Nitrosotalea sp.]